MKTYAVKDPDIWERKQGGGLLAVFGLPFLGFGLAALTGVIPFDDAPWFVPLIFGGIFTLVGTVIVFGRTGIRIDRRLKKVTRWYGLLVPMKSTEYQLLEKGRVSVTRETRRSKNSTYTVYPVRITPEGLGPQRLGTPGPGGAGSGPDSRQGQTISIEEPRSYESARRTAEELAKFTGYDLADHSSGSTVVRKAGSLDESIRDQAQRRGETLVLPPVPPDMRSKVKARSGILTLEIPPRGFSPMSLLMAVPGLIFSVVVIFFFILPLDLLNSKDPFDYAFGGFILLFFIVLPIGMGLLPAIALATKSELLTVSQTSLSLRTRGLLRSKTVDIPISEIEELTVGQDTFAEAAKRLSVKTAKADAMKKMRGMKGGLDKTMKFASLLGLGKGAITARSDNATISFGTGLAKAELKYLHALVRRALIRH